MDFWDKLPSGGTAVVKECMPVCACVRVCMFLFGNQQRI